MKAAVALFRPLASPEEAARAVHWILRVSVFLCFVGHGVFGLRQKAEWLAFMRPFGLDDGTSLLLMPVIGSLDIAFGCLALARPTRGALMLNAFWGIFTASLRPLVGMSFFELIERGGNFGPALALLVGSAGVPLLAQVKPHDFERARVFALVRGVLGGSVFLLLLGHGGLAVSGKPQLVAHWSSIGLGGGHVAFTQAMGWIEIAAACGVLLRPSVALCLGIFVWKLATEALFVPAGAPFWEVVERGGSYGAPLALAVMLIHRWESKQRQALVPSSLGQPS
jgi:hypothetical protein